MTEVGSKSGKMEGLQVPHNNSLEPLKRTVILLRSTVLVSFETKLVDGKHLNQNWRNDRDLTSSSPMMSGCKIEMAIHYS
jgi:hypothetical protein